MKLIIIFKLANCKTHHSVQSISTYQKSDTKKMPGPLARQGIQNIKPHMLSAEASNLPPVCIALNSNESALGPSPLAIAAARAASTGLERYFESPNDTLAPAIADFFGLAKNRITIGQGSDDLLARLARAYLEPGDELIRSQNGYLKVPNYAHANNAVPVSAPDNDFTASVDSILESVTGKTKMVYLANPDNPSGTYLSGTEIRRLHANLPENVLLVLDCAYEEYADASDYEPGHQLVEEAENVVMTRTFSKIFGLAGARIGWLYASPTIIDMVNRIGLTFPVATQSVAACVVALQDKQHVHYAYETNLANRTFVTNALKSLGLKVYPGQTNFVLVQFRDALKTAEVTCTHLRRQGIAIRRFASPAYTDFARITLGHASELKKMTDAIAEFMESAN